MYYGLIKFGGHTMQHKGESSDTLKSLTCNISSTVSYTDKQMQYSDSPGNYLFIGVQYELLQVCLTDAG